MPFANPLIPQRADPFIYKHSDRFYYFTASVPEYDRVELRRSTTIAGLATAAPVNVWRKPDTGPMSALIWAPEIHHIDGAWYVYVAAAPSREIKDGLFQHRIHALSTTAANPLDAPWTVSGRIDTARDTFCLDATSFAHHGQRYFVWAQKDAEIPGNSNLYIARLASATRLASEPVMLSRPEYHWEVQGFLVNEGPAVLIRNGKVFISYSASATDERYCMGLLHADAQANLLSPRSWTQVARARVQYFSRAERVRAGAQQLHDLGGWRARSARLSRAQLSRDRRRPAMESGSAHVCAGSRVG